MPAHLLAQYEHELHLALVHLKYSAAKVECLPCQDLDEESLETWESFTARFARVVDLFSTRYLRARVHMDDPGFNGTLRDFVDYAEKLKLVNSADRMMKARGLRNSVAHEYGPADFAHFLERVRSESRWLLAELESFLGANPP